MEWGGACERHNARDRVIRTGRTTEGRVPKAAVTGGKIRLASLNILMRRLEVLETALWALHQGNVDVGFLQETNLMQGIHTRHGAGYDVWEMEA